MLRPLHHSLRSAAVLQAAAPVMGPLGADTLDEGEPGSGQEPSLGQSVYVGAGTVDVEVATFPVHVKTAPSVPMVLSGLTRDEATGVEVTALSGLTTDDAAVVEGLFVAVGMGGKGLPLPSTVTVVVAQKPGPTKMVERYTVVVSLKTVVVVVTVVVSVAVAATSIRGAETIVAGDGLAEAEAQSFQPSASERPANPSATNDEDFVNLILTPSWIKY